MSEDEYFDDVEGVDDDQMLIADRPVEAKKVKYKSTKGDADKRKSTSKDNMAKARQAKLDKNKQKKKQEEYEYEIDDDGYETVSDEQELYLKKKPKAPAKKRSVAQSGGSRRLDKIESMLEQIMNAKQQSKPARRPVERKTIIQMPQPQYYPQQPQQVDPSLAQIKRKFFDI